MLKRLDTPDFRTFHARGWRHEKGYGNDGWRFHTVTRNSPFRYRYFGVERDTRADAYAGDAPDGGAGWYVYEIVNDQGPQHTVPRVGPCRTLTEAHLALYPYLHQQDEDAWAAALTREAEHRLIDPSLADTP